MKRPFKRLRDQTISERNSHANREMSYIAVETKKWATGAHEARTVRHKYPRNPFHPASLRMYAPATLESTKMPIDSMTCVTTSV